MALTHPAPARFLAGRLRTAASTLIALLLAVLLAAGLVPLLDHPAARAASDDAGRVPVVIHYKDANGATVDFAETSAPYRKGEAHAVVLLNADDALYPDRALSLAVYDRYASFNDQQRDLTDACTIRLVDGTVAIPLPVFEASQALAVVLECEPTHPTYQSLVLANLDTTPLEVEREGRAVTLESDIPSLLMQAEGGAVPFAATFPGVAERHYRLNPYTRLETFDTDMPRKQEAYGIPSDLVGTYGFGVLFGASQHHENGVSTGTNFNDWVLDVNDGSFDAAVERLLYDSIAARNGAAATFATSRSGSDYRDRFVTTGNDYQDTGYSAGGAPDDCAMAFGTCGSAGVSNGYGAVASNPDGDNYIAYKGIYTGPQSQYAGWYTFYYHIAARSAKTHQAFQDIVGYLLVAPVNTGFAQVVKTSTDPAISTANTNYTLQHAVFGAFPTRAEAESAAAKAAAVAWGSWQAARNWAVENASFHLITKADGKSDVEADIEGGDYFVCELFAPLGFRLNNEVKAITVEVTGNEEDVCVVSFADVPQRGSIDLLKQSASPAITRGHPGYSLAGAVYGVYTDAGCTKLFREMRTALDESGDGYCRIDEVPIGSYWVREIKRPLEGYALDTRTYAITVTDRTVSRVNATSVTDRAKLNPLSLLIQKKDAQSGTAHAQGAATLEDAHFRIDYYPVKGASVEDVAALDPAASWTVRTNTEGAFLLDQAESTFTRTRADDTIEEVPYKVGGSPFYKLPSGRIALPIGTYAIQEVKAPAGYLLDEAVHIRHVTDADTDGEIIETFEAEQGGDRITDRVARSDLRLSKRADGASKLAGIPFKITSKTTGEWHILVTDKNGLASTESLPGHPHRAATNGNDEQFRAPDGSFQMPFVLDESALDASCGTWFGLDGEGTSVPVSDEFGALPYDTYELEELRCATNQLFRMIRDEIVVDEHDEGAIIDLGTLNNSTVGRPSIRTSAYDGRSNDLYDSEISADGENLVIDRVSYSGLEPGTTYTLEGVLMDKTTGEPFAPEEGEPVTAALEFTPDDIQGHVNVSFAFDTSSIDVQTELVVFETLLCDGAEVAAHRDLDDRKQTIVVNPIAIGTTAIDSVTGAHEGLPAEEVTLIDTVTYQGLAPGAEYELSALLMDKDANSPWLVDGAIAMTRTTFVPETSSGTVDVEITIPGHDLDGVELVVFESLLHDGLEVSMHADIDDEGQTVSYGRPDLPLPETGGDEPDPEPDSEASAPTPRTRLVQTGDDLIAPLCLAGLLAVAGAALIVAAFRRRRR